MVGGSDGIVVSHSQQDFSDYDVLFHHDSGWWHALDGENINDFFGVGELNTVTHFNGKTNKGFQEISGSGYWKSVDQVGDAVFVAGEIGGGISVPAVARGYR